MFDKFCWDWGGGICWINWFVCCCECILLSWFRLDCWMLLLLIGIDSIWLGGGIFVCKSTGFWSHKLFTCCWLAIGWYWCWELSCWNLSCLSLDNNCMWEFCDDTCCWVILDCWTLSLFCRGIIEDEDCWLFVWIFKWRSGCGKTGAVLIGEIIDLLLMTDDWWSFFWYNCWGCWVKLDFIWLLSWTPTEVWDNFCWRITCSSAFWWRSSLLSFSLNCTPWLIEICESPIGEYIGWLTKLSLFCCWFWLKSLIEEEVGETGFIWDWIGSTE